MLARNAESLYWIGRNVERADNIARILDVTIHQLLEDVTVDRDAASRFLLRVLGIIPSPDIKEFDSFILTDCVAFNRDPSSGSIYDTIAHARENARGAREVISTELWECINSTYISLPERENLARRTGSHAYLTYIENRAAMFTGLADSTLSRDDGYRFMLLGRSIERVDMTVRLLLSRSGDRTDAPAWMSVLRSAGAQDTFLRTYRGGLSANRVVEFLLLDRLFPRSVFHALSVAEKCLEDIEHRPESRIGHQNPARKALGRARSELEFLEIESIVEELPVRLAQLQQLCRSVNESITNQYFYVSPYIIWTDARARDFREEDSL